MSEIIWPYVPVFARIATLILSMPLLSRGIPILAKIGFALALSFLIKQQLPTLEFPATETLALEIISCEVLLGLFISLNMRLILSIAQTSGEFVSLPIGLSLSQLFNSEENSQFMLMSQFMQSIIMLILVSNKVFLNFVVFIFQGNFQAIRQLRSFVNEELTQGAAMILLKLFSLVFEQALLLLLPLLFVLILIFIAMGMISRIAPQINLLIVGLPLQLGVGLLLLFLLLAPLSQQLARFIGGFFENFPETLGQLLTINT